ncbi:MinD/ParA family protein [Candidatus Woesearchaeota archaeon]|jgi:septum site-determining protein MinD|nr:MinD/ParA family protein [Candidatus Woesearchaeota archaeon]MBT5273048.1 MinD/ParA family protein [Candidatus Woesearchaeota archaeon]MBT6040816.1 MinD/ParA family protein [Candidatus Woesearchaeota archaeon]MBT6337637.1 MinD/ParA family protein [Candidatus Woesearchaeota archaeon]MBT7926962.1 MinD/ParA family protein [Candidatus Woesearchaeota archaeon]
MTGKTIGVIAIKGGVGKTTTVTNLAYVLSNVFGKKVLAIDANFSAPTLGQYLGIKENNFTLHDVLNDRAPISDAIIKHEKGFDIIPSSLVPKKINPYDLKDKIEHLKEYYDVIILDSSPNLNEEILATMVASDELFVVTTPDKPTLNSTVNAINVAQKKKTPIKGIILNRVRDKKFEVNIGDIELSTNVPVVAVLPDDLKVLEALSFSIPASAHAPDRDLSVEYKKLGGCIIGDNFNDERLKTKFKKIFGMSASKQDVNRCCMLEESKLK